MNAYYRRAESLGVEIRYDATVAGLAFDGYCCTTVAVETNGGRTEHLDARAVVAATGGFEANIEWLREYWGDRVDNYAVRGTSFNDGSLLREILDAGAEARGNPTRAPRDRRRRTLAAVRRRHRHPRRLGAVFRRRER